MSSREIPELMGAALTGSRAFDFADEIRISSFYSEFTYLGMQIWERENAGLTPKGEFARTTLPILSVILSSQHGVAWWGRWRPTHRDEFIAMLEAAIPALAQHGPEPKPLLSPIGKQPAESAVAPPADAG